MKLLSELILAVVGVVEHEIKTAQRNTSKIVSITAIAFGLLLTGMALVIWGLFIVLMAALGPIAASFIAGGVAIISAVVLLTTAQKLSG